MAPNRNDASVVTKVVVGSRLHGLENDNSDWDYRGIFLGSLRDRVSPFKTFKTTDWLEGDEDNTAYELAEFCKYATRGNATILEILFSDQIIESSALADEMRANWQRFMDTHEFVKASCGYAKNNKKKFEERDPVGVKGQFRRHKFAIAYCRVLWQCREFLKTGQFKCRIDEGEFKNLLLKWKNSWDDSYTMDAIGMYYGLEAEVWGLEKTSPYKDLKPDIEWIEDFIYMAYTSQAVPDLERKNPLDAFERGEISATELGKILKK
jgi:predicted nucleotidyltransferase